MSDVFLPIAVSSAQVVKTRYVDMGDGTYAQEVVAAPPAPKAVAWDGSAKDMRAYGVVTITCTAAPATPWTINAGDGINAPVPQTAVVNTASGVGQSSTISAVGRYSLAGGVMLLSGGSGGVFSISGGQ